MLLRSGRRLGVRAMMTVLEGQTISKGTTIELPKKSGDFVKTGEVIAIVEMDKMAIDIPSPTCGVISDFKVSIGDTVSIGDPIATIDNPLVKLRDEIQEKKNKTWEDIDHFVNEFHSVTQFFATEDAIKSMARDPVLRQNNIRAVSYIYGLLYEIPMYLTTKETNVRLAVKRANSYQSTVKTIYTRFNKYTLARVKKVPGYVE